MRIVLEIVEGAAAGRKKALRAPLVLTIGRGEAADWMVPEDSAMSSRHFQISLNQDGCTLTDLDSTNGTLVDGQRIARHTLEDGQRITAGSTVFQVCMAKRKPTLIAGLEPPSRPSPTATSDSNAKVTEKVAEKIGTYQHGPPRSRSFSGAVIEVVSDHAAGRKSILRPGHTVTVGRTEQSDFVISDPMLSAEHFSVASTPSGWQLIDLNSASGTTVDGIKVSKTILKTGDRIVAGQTQFVVTIGQSAPTGRTGAASSYPFQEGVRDQDAKVRRSAIEAAAWSGEPWLLDFCRDCSNNLNGENKEALAMFAILAGPTDLDALCRLAGADDLGPDRMQYLASFGHPAVVPVLLNAISGDDIKLAVAAASAFARITGVDVASNQRVTLPPSGDEADQDEYDQEFAEDAMMPDVDKAQRVWQKLSSQFASGSCFRQGVEVAGGPSAEVLGRLDMRSRWEACVRGKYEGTWNGRPFDLDRFFNP